VTNELTDDWRGEARSAFALTLDFDAEEVWIGANPENAHRPGLLSQGTYGAKEWRLVYLDTAGRYVGEATIVMEQPDRWVGDAYVACHPA